MLFKKITRLLAVATMGLMIGSSVKYAAKEYGLLSDSANWAKLEAQDTATVPTTALPLKKKINCNDYDLTKYTCKAKAVWKTEYVVTTTNIFGKTSVTKDKYGVNVQATSRMKGVIVIIKTPACVNDEYSVCLKSHVMDNRPEISTIESDIEVTINNKPSISTIETDLGITMNNKHTYPTVETNLEIKQPE